MKLRTKRKCYRKRKKGMKGKRKKSKKARRYKTYVISSSYLNKLNHNKVIEHKDRF